ncbi:MAG: prepilin peptidase [Candidatus Thorarchaeota archaeon]
MSCRQYLLGAELLGVFEMALEISVQGILAFGLVVALLTVFSLMDLKTRKVPNEVMSMSFALGLLMSIVTGHLIDQLYLHLVGIFLAVVFAIPLFYMNAIGGADVKTVILLQFISPGLELGTFAEFVTEGMIGVFAILLSMLALGLLYSRSEGKIDRKQTPLIPFLFVGYLLMQFIVLL